MLRKIEDGSGSKGNELLTDLDELAREGARRMLLGENEKVPTTSEREIMDFVRARFPK